MTKIIQNSSACLNVYACDVLLRYVYYICSSEMLLWYKQPPLCVVVGEFSFFHNIIWLSFPFLNRSLSGFLSFSFYFCCRRIYFLKKYRVSYFSSLCVLFAVVCCCCCCCCACFHDLHVLQEWQCILLYYCIIVYKFSPD